MSSSRGKTLPRPVRCGFPNCPGTIRTVFPCDGCRDVDAVAHELCMQAFLRENKLALDAGSTDQDDESVFPRKEHYCREKCLLMAYSSLQEQHKPSRQLQQSAHRQQEEESSSSSVNDTPMRQKYPPVSDERDPSEQEEKEEEAPCLVEETPAFQRRPFVSDQGVSFKRGNAQKDGSDGDENPVLLAASADSNSTSAATSLCEEYYHPHARMKPQPPAHDERDPEDAAARKLLEKETSRLVMSLVAETPEFQQHPLSANEGGMGFKREISKSLIDKLPAKRTAPGDDIPPAFHPIELSDWESEINNWSALDNNNGTGTAPDPLAALERPRNHHLDHLTFDDDTASGGDDDYTAELRERARRAPLILELGVAGRSVARRVYPELSLVQQHPAPAVRSAAYRDRQEREAAAAASQGSSLMPRSTCGGGRTVPSLSMGPGGRLTIVYSVDVLLVFCLLTHSLSLSLLCLFVIRRNGTDRAAESSAGFVGSARNRVH